MKRKATTQGGIRKKPRLVRQGTAARMPLVRSVLPATLRTRGAEVKTVDINPNYASCDSTGTWVLLNALTEGPGFNNRIGRKIAMKSLHLTGFFSQTGQTPGQAEYVRVMVIYDRQPNGAAFAFNDLLQDVNYAGTTNNTSMSGINMNNAERFLTLCDIRLNAPNTSAAGVTLIDSYVTDQNNEINIKRFIRLKGLEAHYKANNGNITDLSTGALYLFCCGNVANGSNTYNFFSKARLRYTDT